MPNAMLSRVVSIALALLVVVGAWLAFEYGQRPPPAVAEPLRPGGDAALRRALSPELAAPLVGSPAVTTSTTYRCELGGRVSFSDQPCRGKEVVRSVTVVENASPRPHDHRLEEMRLAADALEAARLARERQYASDLASRVATPASSAAANDLRCAQIDQAIAAIDALMLKPHSASAGDYWNSERKKRYDERFSMAC